jgi:hypothetical protein
MSGLFCQPRECEKTTAQAFSSTGMLKLEMQFGSLVTVIQETCLSRVQSCFCAIRGWLLRLQSERGLHPSKLRGVAGIHDTLEKELYNKHGHFLGLHFQLI